MNIAEICTRELVMADKEASLQQAATLMRQHHVGTLVIVASTAEGTQAVTQTPIGRLAEGKLAVVPGTASVEDAIAAMKKRGVRRLLVANESGQLAGSVSLDDLLDAVAHDVAELAHIGRAGIEREAAERTPLPQAQPPQAVHIPAYSFV